MDTITGVLSDGWAWVAGWPSLAKVAAVFVIFRLLYAAGKRREQEQAVVDQAARDEAAQERYERLMTDPGHDEGRPPGPKA